MQRILIYGGSIILAGLAAQLANHPEIQIYRRETLVDLGDLTACDAVLVDFDDAQAGDVLSLLRARPDLKIVGVNSTNSAVTVLSGRVYLAQTLTDVVMYLE